MKKKWFSIVLIFTMVCLIGAVKQPTQAAGKTSKNTYTFVKGVRSVLAKSGVAPFKATVKIANKSIVKIKKKDFYIYVTGRKVGKTKVTVTMHGKTTVYTVKIVSKKTADRKAVQALEQKASELTIKKGALTDLNGDGVTDLFADGVLYGYSLKSGRVLKRESGAVPDAIDKLYVSKKEKRIYMQAVSGSSLRVLEPDPSDEEEGADYYKGDFVGLFYQFDKNAVFNGESGGFILKYAHPRLFVGEGYKEGTDYFCYYDPSYDQDDYWYEPFTADGIMGRVKESMPDAVEVPLSDTL